MGIKGDKGEEGSRGSSGSPGIRGVKGEQGSKGEKGEIVNSAETVFFCCCFFPPNQYFFSFQISIFALEFPFLRFRGRMAYQECLEFLAPQGRKDNKEKKELRESLVSRDRGDRGAPGKMGLKKDKGNEGSRGRCFTLSVQWIKPNNLSILLTDVVPQWHNYPFEHLMAWPPFPAAFFGLKHCYLWYLKKESS